jgi:fumarylacetoacetate (FAA) hydrolase
VVTDVPQGATAEQAAPSIKLLMLLDDISFRNLIPGELAKGFGFFQSKPSTAFSPVAVTTDELGPAWREAKLNRQLLVHLNGRLFGRPDAGTDMTFDFGRLIAHAA